MLIKLWYNYRMLVTMAVQSKALTAFHCSNTGTVILKPTKEADVCCLHRPRPYNRLIPCPSSDTRCLETRFRTQSNEKI